MSNQKIARVEITCKGGCGGIKYCWCGNEIVVRSGYLLTGPIWYACIWRRLDNTSAGEWRGTIFPTLEKANKHRDTILSTHPLHRPEYVRTVRVIRTSKGDITHPADDKLEKGVVYY